MTIEADFSEMMIDEVTVAPKTSVDSYGKRTWGTAVTYQCRVSYVTRLMKDTEGREKVSSGRVYIYGVANVDPASKITLPGGQTPVIVNIDTVSDQFGQHHTTIHFE